MLNLGGWDLRCEYHDISSYMQELKDLVTLDLSDNTQLTVCPANVHVERKLALACLRWNSTALSQAFDHSAHVTLPILLAQGLCNIITILCAAALLIDLYS